MEWQAQEAGGSLGIRKCAGRRRDCDRAASLPLAMGDVSTGGLWKEGSAQDVGWDHVGWAGVWMQRCEVTPSALAGAGLVGKLLQRPRGQTLPAWQLFSPPLLVQKWPHTAFMHKQ